MSPLQTFRTQIDQIDEKILKLILERMKISQEVARVKKEQGSEVFDEKREKELLQRLSDKTDSELFPGSEMEKIWKVILEQSRVLQREIGP